MSDHYLKDIDEAAFKKWLDDTGWEEDRSPGTEGWPVPAWWHDGRCIVRREDWLAEEYEDFLFQSQKEAL
jgi:hypothetical protein